MTLAKVFLTKVPHIILLKLANMIYIRTIYLALATLKSAVEVCTTH